MPRTSARKELLENIRETAITILQRRNEDIRAMLSDSSSEDSSEDLPESWADATSESSLSFMSISMMSVSLASDSSMAIDSDSEDSTSSIDEILAPYARMLNTIQALHDEVEIARVIDRREGKMPKISQLELLHYFAEDRVSLFRKKVRVDPPIFDDILDQISDHAVFHNQSNNRQLPVSVQLAIFLNRVGHYGNSSSPEDIAQWAGVSVGTVVNCTNRVMASLLAQHDAFINIPHVYSNDTRQARLYAEFQTCRGWRNGVFAADGTAVNLYSKPGMYGDGFYDRKSNFSLNCQVGDKEDGRDKSTHLHLKAIIMPHNLLIVDYALGQPGSVHDAHAFQKTRMYQDPTLIPQHHWIWADSAYPSEKWCAVPFKKPHGGRLTRRQNTYNRYLSKVCILCC